MIPKLTMTTTLISIVTCLQTTTHSIQVFGFRAIATAIIQIGFKKIKICGCRSKYSSVLHVPTHRCSTGIFGSSIHILKRISSKNLGVRVLA